MMNNKKLLVIFIVLAMLSLGVIGVAAQTGGETPETAQTALGTGFTYQGYLEDDSGNPLTTTCDIQFRLWDALVSGTQIGNVSYADGVDIKSGYFTARVNTGNEFGSAAFAGDSRWLAVSVSCPVGSTPVSLTPRQALSAVPYALSARSVHSSEDIELYLSPYSTMSRSFPANLTFAPLSSGGVTIKRVADSDGERLAVIPVSTYGKLFGATMYVKSVEVCYKRNTNGPQWLDGVGVFKGNGETYAAYLTDSTNRTSATRECFTATATTRAAIDNSSYVQLHLNWQGVGSLDDAIIIYSVKITLTEIP